MDTTLHPNVAHVADVLAAHGATGRPHVFTEPVPTAAAAAEQLGVDVGAIANSLIFNADGEAVLILASGAHRVDTTRCATLLGVSSLRRAQPEFVRDATGQRAGGVAPVGHPTRLRTLVDVWLRQYPEVWCGAGEPSAVFPTSFDELLRLTGGTPAEIGD